MKRSRKSNRVSWAPGVNLCQVKLFLREDCPSKVGGERQDTLQAKISSALRPSGMCANDLPPGFEAGNYASGLKCDLAKIPRIQWKSPPVFALNLNWHVTAGEESKEVYAQELREKKMLEAVYPRVSQIPPKYVFILEAVYPRVSQIPPNPVSLEVEAERYDDIQIPLVPLTPIEDDAGAELCSDIVAQPKTPSNSETLALLLKPQGVSNPGTQYMPHCSSSAAEAPGASSDMMATALAALTAVMKSKEQGSLVDTDLLVKILGDPKMVEKLIHNRGYPSAAANGIAVSAPATISSPKPVDRNLNHLVEEYRPTLSKPASMADDIVSVSMPKRVESSVSLPVQASTPKRVYSSAPLPVSVSMPIRVESSVPLSVSMPLRVDSSVPLSVPISMPKRVESSVPLPGSNINTISGRRAANGNAYSTMNQVQPALSRMPGQPNSAYKMQPTISSTTMHTMEANAVRDANYFKNLIREHGREKEEAKGHYMSQTGNHLNHIQNLKVVQNLKPVAIQTKFRKPCMFFNSPKGCRQGSNCPYLHGKKTLQLPTDRMLEAQSAKRLKLSGMLEAQSAKRLKLSGEITGRI